MPKYKSYKIGKYIKSGGKYIRSGTKLKKVIPGMTGLASVVGAGALAGVAIGKAYGDFSRAQRKYSTSTNKRQDRLTKLVKSRRRKRKRKTK